MCPHEVLAPRVQVGTAEIARWIRGRAIYLEFFELKGRCVCLMIQHFAQFRFFSLLGHYALVMYHLVCASCPRCHLPHPHTMCSSTSLTKQISSGTECPADSKNFPCLILPDQRGIELNPC